MPKLTPWNYALGAAGIEVLRAMPIWTLQILLNKCEQICSQFNNEGCGAFMAACWHTCIHTHAYTHVHTHTHAHTHTHTHTHLHTYTQVDRSDFLIDHGLVVELKAKADKAVKDSRVVAEQEALVMEVRSLTCMVLGVALRQCV